MPARAVAFQVLLLAAVFGPVCAHGAGDATCADSTCAALGPTPKTSGVAMIQKTKVVEKKPQVIALTATVVDFRVLALQSTAHAIPVWQTAAASLCAFAAGAGVVMFISGYAASRECGACQAVEAAPLVAKPAGKGEAACASRAGAEEPSLLGPALVALLSIPALLGSCCWPLLVAGMLGMAQLSTVSSRALAHAVSFGLNTGMFVALLPQLAGRTAARRGAMPPGRRWAPFCLVLLGAVLVMLDLTRHMLLDQGIGENVLPMYNDDATLTAVGRAGVVCTWSGVALLFVGVAWLTGLPVKLGFDPEPHR